MITENVNKLKRFIQICDSEIFPTNPSKVFIVNKRYRERGMASFNLRDMPLYQTLIYLLVSFFDYGWNIFLYLITNQRKYERNTLHALGLSGYHSKSLNPIWYQVNIKSVYSKQTDFDLAYIAWHEVRHRVQMASAYTYDQVDSDDEKGLLKFFNDTGTILDSYVLDSPEYSDSEKNRETDANFIAHCLEIYAKREIGTDTITEEVFRNFTKEYLKLLTWKNPNVEL